jgi:hypothetical protein
MPFRRAEVMHSPFPSRSKRLREVVIALVAIVVVLVVCAAVKVFGSGLF